MYAVHGSPNEIHTLVQSMLNNAAFDLRLPDASHVWVNVMVRNSDGAILRDTVHV